MWTSPDRWTCPHPDCHVTEVPDVPEGQLAAAIREIQEIHAKDHPAPWIPPTPARHPLRRRSDRTTR